MDYPFSHSFKAIQAQVRSVQAARSNLAGLVSSWEEYVQAARQALPGIHIEDQGEIVTLGELSPGCQACKDGTWDCFFLTSQCNLTCPFCYSAISSAHDFSGSGFGRTWEEITRAYDRTTIKGVSFSGGESFLKPTQLVSWLADYKTHFPGLYYWVYTNGLLVTEDLLKQLGDMGLNEIRFNTAATGYNHTLVTHNLELAVKHISAVTVEIPAIPEQADNLLKALPVWDSLGVKYLNLHELIYEPGTLSAHMAGARRRIITEDGHNSEFNPNSRNLILRVLCMVQEDRLKLSVNDCSMQSKIRQLRGRRNSLIPLVRQEFERVVSPGRLETLCTLVDEPQPSFLHPDNLTEFRLNHPDLRFFRLERLAPLSVYDRSIWVICEEL